MAKKQQVDVRKLKDEVADYLKKQKWEKATEVLEQLVGAEPKDMQHRLKLGDTYRRTEQIQKSVAAYGYAAKAFADEGQLIKAIGAVKVILEIDPGNTDAQKQLAEMNERRMSKVTLEGAGLKPARGIGAGARATSPIELEEPDEAANAVSSAIAPDPYPAQPPPMPSDDEPLELVDRDASDDEPLELDDRKSSKPAPLPQRGFTPGSPARAKVAPPKDASSHPSAALDLDLAAPATQLAKLKKGKAKPPRGEVVDLDPDMPAPDAVPEKLPEDAILTPSAEDLASSPDEDELALDDDVKPAVPPPFKPRAPPPRNKAAASAVTVSEEITLEDAGPARSPQKPPPGEPLGVVSIADLLASETDEEVELLSISSDEEAVGERPTTHAERASDEADLEAAFGTIEPRAGARRKRVPTKKVPLFDDLSQEAFVELVNKVAYHRHVADQLIIREGDPGRSFYVIVEGKVRIYKTGPDGKEITLAHLGEGAFFGEMALLSGAPRTANVVAEEDTEILEVTDVVLRELAGKYPQVVSSLKNFYRQRLLNNVMAISPLFMDFDPGERKQIVEKFRMKQAAPGEVLIEEGTNSDGLYVVLHGGVQVAKSKNKRPIELARLKEGDIFGEMSLLTRKPATATVTSQGNAILLRLPRENFQELVLTHPQILALVSELTEKRKSATEAILRGQGEGHDGMSFV
jgi:CRP-like cAMP-binding protein/tetratricopeptide (TPR) repeat protein